MTEAPSPHARGELTIAVHALAPELGSIKQANTHSSLFQNGNLLKSVKIFFSPKLGLDIAGAGRSGLDFFLLLLPQDPLGEQEVRGRDVVVPVGFQGPGETGRGHRHLSRRCVQAELRFLKSGTSKWKPMLRIFKMMEDHKQENNYSFLNDDVKGNPSYAPISNGKLAWQEKRKLLKL